MKLPSFRSISKEWDGKEAVSKFKFLLSHSLWLRESKGPYFAFKRLNVRWKTEYHGEESVTGRWAMWHNFHPIPRCEKCLCSAVWGWTVVVMARMQLLCFGTVPPFYHPVKIHEVILLLHSLLNVFSSICSHHTLQRNCPPAIILLLLIMCSSEKMNSY